MAERYGFVRIRTSKLEKFKLENQKFYPVFSESTAPIDSAPQENGAAREQTDSAAANPNTEIPLSEEKTGSPVKLKKLTLAGAELYFANNVSLPL